MRAGQERSGVSRLVDVLRDSEHIVPRFVVLGDFEAPHGSDAEARVPNDGEQCPNGIVGDRSPLREKINDRLGPVGLPALIGPG